MLGATDDQRLLRHVSSRPLATLKRPFFQPKPGNRGPSQGAVGKANLMAKMRLTSFFDDDVSVLLKDKYHLVCDRNRFTFDHSTGGLVDYLVRSNAERAL